MPTNNVLVSVVVLAYNSSSTIIETLNSVKEQTYGNIELIITDDGSLDTTIDICKQWLALNEKDFHDCKLITTEVNTGLPANCNRALHASTGEWIKFIAADDSLKRECIEINVKYISANTEVEILQTNAEVYIDIFDPSRFSCTLPNNFKEFFDLDEGRNQYDFLKDKGYPLCTPSIFLKKCIIQQIGGFDERFNFIEDMPLWLKLTKINIKIFYYPVSTVNYRSHDKSIARDGKKYINAKFAKESLFLLRTLFQQNERSVRIKSIIRQLKCVIILDRVGFNNNSFFSKILYYLSTKL